MLPPKPVRNNEHHGLTGCFPRYFAIVAVKEIVPVAFQVNQFAIFGLGIFDHDGYAIQRVLKIKPTFLSFQHDR
ncbi:hypothetical protein D3C86_1892350 [compost metagenome]